MTVVATVGFSCVQQGGGLQTSFLRTLTQHRLADVAAVIITHCP